MQIDIIDTLTNLKDKKRRADFQRVFERGLASYGGHFTTAAAVGAGALLVAERETKPITLTFDTDMLHIATGIRKPHSKENEKFPPWLRNSDLKPGPDSVKILRKAENIDSWRIYFRSGKLPPSKDREVWTSRLLGVWAAALILGENKIGRAVNLFESVGEKYWTFAKSENDKIIALHTFLEALLAFMAALTNLAPAKVSQTREKFLRFALDAISGRLQDIPNAARHTLNLPIACNLRILMHFLLIEGGLGNASSRIVCDSFAEYLVANDILTNSQQLLRLPPDYSWPSMLLAKSQEQVNFLAAAIVAINPSFWITNPKALTSISKKGMIVPRYHEVSHRYLLTLADFVSKHLSHFGLRSGSVIQRIFFIFGDFDEKDKDIHAYSHEGIQENILIHFLHLAATDAIRRNQLHYFAYIHVPVGSIRHPLLLSVSLLLWLRDGEKSNEAVHLRFYRRLFQVIRVNRAQIPLADALLALEPDNLIPGKFSWLGFLASLGTNHRSAVDGLIRYLRSLPPANFSAFLGLHSDLESWLSRVIDPEESSTLFDILANPGQVPRKVVEQLLGLTRHAIDKLEARGYAPDALKELRDIQDRIRTAISQQSSIRLSYELEFRSASVPLSEKLQKECIIPASDFNDFDIRLWLAQGEIVSARIGDNTLPMLPPLVMNSQAKYKGIISPVCTSIPLGKNIREIKGEKTPLLDYVIFQSMRKYTLLQHAPPLKKNVLVILGDIRNPSANKMNAGESNVDNLLNPQLLAEMDNSFLQKILRPLVPTDGCIIIYRSDLTICETISRSEISAESVSLNHLPAPALRPAEVFRKMETDIARCHTFLYLGHGQGALDARSAGLAVYPASDIFLSVAYLRTIFEAFGAPSVCYLNCCFGGEDGLRNAFKGYAENPQIVSAFLDYGCRLALSAPVRLWTFGALKRFFPGFLGLLAASTQTTLAENCYRYLGSERQLNFLDFLQILGNPFLVYENGYPTFKAATSQQDVALFNLDITPELSADQAK